MTSARLLSLPEIPATLEDLHGHPRFGTFQGELDAIALGRLRGPFALPPLFRFLKRKRWVYAQVVTQDLVAVAAIVDLGYTSNAFVSVLDLRSRMALYDESFLGLPGTRVEVNDHPGQGLHAHFRRPGAQVTLDRARGADRFHLDVRLRNLVPLGESLTWEADLVVPGAPPALTVISPVAGDGVVNVTQKRAAMLSLGRLTLGHRTWSLDGGVGGMDYTQGLLARHTRWRWAHGNGRLADGTALGFNLVAGFNEESPRCNENAVWVGDQLFPLPRAHFHFDRADPGGPWTVETSDGSAKLRFSPLHLHREARDYKLVRSHFVQPLGVFSGTLRVGGRTVVVENLGGVTEDQDILW
jgi:general stress protein CsbA